MTTIKNTQTLIPMQTKQSHIESANRPQSSTSFSSNHLLFDRASCSKVPVQLHGSKRSGSL